MQTLDRRISASSDQLDTLKKQKNRQKPFRTRSSSRLSYERKFDTEEAEFKVPTFHPKPNNNKETSREVTKTPFEIFLEDDGPYSRKLYGPVTPKPSAIDRSRGLHFGGMRITKTQITFEFLTENIVYKEGKVIR